MAAKYTSPTLAKLFPDEPAATPDPDQVWPYSNDTWRRSIASIAWYSHPTVHGVAWDIRIGDLVVCTCTNQAAAIGIVGGLRLLAYQLWGLHRQLITDLLVPEIVGPVGRPTQSTLMALQDRLAAILTANSTPDMYAV